MGEGKAVAGSVRQPGKDATRLKNHLRDKLRAVVLLGGAVRSTALAGSIGRSVFDLPVDREDSILGLWHKHAMHVLEVLKLDQIALRVMIDRDSIPPMVTGADSSVRLHVEVDATKFRGTGGILRELASDYEDDDLLLVANGAQTLVEPLSDLMLDLAEDEGDISIISHDDGTPSGLMLVRCGVLDLVAPIGYVDMKEQALPKIAQEHEVRVLNRRQATGLPLRTLDDYIGLLRRHHRMRQVAGEQTREGLAEDWRPTFGVIEPGAEVDPTARVHDSVVLDGGHVERGSALVRSLVCPGGVVRRNTVVVDQIITAESKT